ncbi:hypothetical protein [Nocardia sp. IFM 10818]
MNAKKLGTGAIAASLLFGVIGCSEDSEATPTPVGQTVSAQPTTTKATPDPKSEEVLKQRADTFNGLTVAKDWDGLWNFYSQRCQAKAGNVDTLRSMAEIALAGRTPQPNPVTVRISGSAAQVVTVDNDPNAPADSMKPRTWTFIDGAWMFDNC